MNIENKNLLPVITSENDVYPYLKKINQFPILTDEEEKRLALDWLKTVSYTHLPSPRDLSTSRMPSSA